MIKSCVKYSTNCFLNCASVYFANEMVVIFLSNLIRWFGRNRVDWFLWKCVVCSHDFIT